MTVENGTFEKGHVPWNKGKMGISGPWRGKKRPPFSDEWRMNMSKAKKGKVPKNLDLLHSPECRKKQADAIRGRKVPAEQREKIRQSLKNRIKRLGYMNSPEAKQKMSLAKQGSVPWNKDKNCPQLAGANNGNWKGGTMSRMLERVSNLAWKRRRREIYQRDKWTCLYCGKHVRKDIQCHHVMPYRLTQDDSFKNLITLCCICHALFERTFDHEFLFQGKLFSA